MLCPPGWSCLSLVCGLVSGLVCHLGWDAVSASLGRLRSCLPACLPSGLGCSVRLPGLVFLLSLVLSPQLLSLFCLVACLSSGMLCLPPRACLFLVSGLVSQLVSHLVWDAVFAFLARLPAQLVSGLLSHPVFQLVWCVRALGLSPKFHVRFVQLFGVYGGVISGSPKRWDRDYITRKRRQGPFSGIQVEPGKPGAEVSKKKTISQRKNLPIECAQGDQPLRCPNRVF